MIRQLHAEDRSVFARMHTGIEDDYILHIFDRLVTGNSYLYGLFIEEQLVTIGGFTIFQNTYAMLGRLRTDTRYRGQNLSTKLMETVIDKAFSIPEIQWVGANTQEHNTSARRVLTKLGLTPTATLHGATTQHPERLTNGSERWSEITDKTEKLRWLEKAYTSSGNVFPYECYYPFPATPSLFSEDDVANWRFFQNATEDRFFVAKKDQKKYHYVHLAYPWPDAADQPGLWETVTTLFEEQTKETGDLTYVWLDLTKEMARTLPSDHPFDLPSPWILHGTYR
ncbi:GNAT family N-acetyltransferase [Geomicrobium sp. JSM 1781026]